MGQFFKFVFASCLGVILASVALSIIGTMMLVGVATNAEQPKAIEQNSVLALKFDEPIPERTNNVPINAFELDQKKVLGLQDIINSIEKAKSDDDIKGIYLECDGLPTGFASMTNLREALADFKESGKFVIAYSRYYTQGAYYLASVADKIYVNPMGGIDLRGFAAQIPFFKEMLDKIGIKMQVFYAGDFKSATEPYRRTEMSEENRLQTREYVDAVYNNFLEGLSKGRGISVAELKNIANNYSARKAQQAVSLGLVDVAGYKDEAMSEMRSKIGLEEKDKLNFVSLRSYNNSRPPSKKYKGSDRIAVIYAEGTIIDGKGENGSIGDAKYTKIIEKVRKDDKVKAIVLRVNSPGGSAMSSENIWRELTLAKEAGKKIVVSMGDYAASGGYYISCMADVILAEPNTLTGSIGVFNMMPDASELLNDKMGIRFDTVKTGQFSTGIMPFYPMTEQEGRLVQAATDDIYETFLKRVAEGRGMTRDEVHKIAQGRVWTGNRATELGLVDQIGGLETAIEKAAELAEIDDFRLKEYPQIKEPFQQILEELLDMEESFKSKVLQKELGDYYTYYKYFDEIKNMKGVQARLPFIIVWE